MDIIKYYTDYVDDVNKKFPTLSKEEIKSILYYGFKIFSTCNMTGLDTLHKSNYFTAYVGKLFYNSLLYFHYKRIKYKKKLRYIYKRKKTKYNGKYYFGLTEKEFQYYQAQRNTRGRKRVSFNFRYIYAYKIKEELFVDRTRKYFFELEYPEDMGWTMYRENWTTWRARYFAYRDAKGNIINVDDKWPEKK